MAFRFDAKKALFTYANCPQHWTIDFVFGCFYDFYCPTNQMDTEESPPVGLKQLAVGKEFHSSGAPHYHVFCQWISRCRVRSYIQWDIEGRHPNIQCGRNAARLLGYTLKGGEFRIMNPVTWKHWTGYVKDKLDYEHWIFDNSRLHLADPFPLLLPNGYTIEADEVHKKRHWWFTSRPDWGKTLWINRKLAGKRFWYAKSKDLAFEGYSGEPVVVFNDCFPKLECLLETTEIFDFDVPVYGRTRYRRYYWGRGVRRWVLCFTNEPPNYADHEAFRARFTMVDLNLFPPFAHDALPTTPPDSLLN